MCGINGIYAYGASASRCDPQELAATRDAMLRRGPDGWGEWLAQDQRIALGHRRLAIIDLSPAGAQPMATEDGRLVVSFNGEIYNYPELRAELQSQGVQFRSHSDTEVLLHLYRRDGINMLYRLRGMFAFALWDEGEKVLLLARDPHGIKPLYYSDNGGTLRFASQVSALKAGGAVDTDPDPAGAVGFLLWGSVPEPFTLHRGIRQLPAGSYLLAKGEGVSSPQRYWHLRDVLLAGREAAAAVPPGHEQDYLRSTLLDSVRAHLLADVPVGAFLSAGLDSSTLVGLASEASSTRLETITLGFDEFRGSDKDECPLAKQTADHLKVSHRCIMFSADELEAELDRFFAAMDQPTVDGINTWLVSSAASRAGLKVALSGLGGDELLGGYGTFQQVPEMVRRARRLPFGSVGRFYRAIYARLARWGKWPPNEAGLFEYGQTAEGAYHLAKGVFMPWELKAVLKPDVLDEGLHRLAAQDAAITPGMEAFSPFEQVAYLESARYMRNQLLRDSDWVSMAHSLEIRVPLVDRVLTEKIAGLAAAGRLGKGKQMLHRTLSQGLPQAVIERPKTGFTTPTWKWLRHHPGLDAWRSVPLLRQPHLRDSRRWAYTLLHRTPGVSAMLRD